MSDIYLFKVEDYEILGLINMGGFGKINLVRNKLTGERYAAKTSYIQTKAQNKIFFTREVRILIQIQHPTIIRFRGFSNQDFEGKKNITILMDYMKEGSLADLIAKEMQSLCPSDFNNTKRQIILIGIARGMMILHNHHVIHRDLKPENILLDDDFHPHITDFGLSKFFDPHHSMNQSMSNSGTSPYMAPEVINSDHFNTKADVFAFGILMYEVVTGKRAYSEFFNGKKKINDFQLKMKVIEGLRPKFEEDGTINKNIRFLIEKCWSENPKERPSFSEIYRKLSLSRDDYFFKFDENNTESIIIDDDDEEIEENEEENEEELFLNKKYCLNDVDCEEVLNYIDEINEKPKSLLQKETTNNDVEIKKLKEKISSLESELLTAKSDNSEFKSQMMIMSKTINDQSNKIIELERKLQNSKDSSHFFNVDISLTKPGIFYQLKNNEKTPFDRLFIASQSSNDLYNVIDPSTKDMFGVAFNSYFDIEFILENEIVMNGFKVFSSYKGFPKSFDIEVEGRLIHQISNANELNGKNKEMKLLNNPIRGKKIKFIRRGPSWDKGENFYTIKRFEILSNDNKEVFSNLVKANNNDPHKCPVLINATFFDFNRFYMINEGSNLSTLNEKDSWFQVELTKGVAIITGFRLQRSSFTRMQSFKFQCKTDGNWLNLLECNDSKDNLIAVYKLPQLSPPTNLVRLIQTQANSDGTYFMNFVHFDIFGTYI